MKMAFVISGPSVIISLSLSPPASHLPSWPPHAQYLMCCKTLSTMREGATAVVGVECNHGCRVTSLDPGRLWPGPAQPSEIQIQAPRTPGPKMHVDAPPPRVWDCCAATAMSDETHLVSPRPSTHPGRLATRLMASIPGLSAWEGGGGADRVWGA